MVLEIFNRLDVISEINIEFLEYENCFQLLIGVILSAQTTDKQVNRVLPELFKQYPDSKKMSEAEKHDIIKIIHSIGFYNAKAENIIKTSKMVYQRFNGKVPEGMDELLELPGVGRKSANVIRGACFDMPAIIVDTHFKRVVFRLGLTKSENPVFIEKEIDLMVPEKLQYRFSMLINKHGRTFCKAKNPLCGECTLSDICSKNLPDQKITATNP